MTPRERVLVAMRRQIPDRVPKHISWGFTLPVMDLFREKTGAQDPNEYFDIEMRLVDLASNELKLRDPLKEAKQKYFKRYFDELPGGTQISEWGSAYAPGSIPYYHKIISPMQNFTSVKEVENYPFPHFCEEWRLKILEDEIKEYHKKNLAVGGGPSTTIFETSWALRGMENLLIDFMTNEDFANYLLDKVTQIYCNTTREYAKKDVDILMLGDDIATQRGMMMSLNTWRKKLKGRLAKIIKVAKETKPDILIFYDTDGDCRDVIPELIEIGVDILSPVQPECMDPLWVKKEYGDYLSFWGTIGVQNTLSHGTSSEVKREVKKRIESVGYNGGLFIGPAHVFEPDIPWENIVALYEAVKEYGRY